jgi:hypothetical protein
MRFSFMLKGIKPFSVNSLFYNDGRTKTQAYYDWSFKFFGMLCHESVQLGLEPMREQFDPKKHCFAVRLTAYYPEKIFYRQVGGISAKTMDLSNWEKPLIDALFLPKNHKVSPPFGSPNMNCDDRYIASIVSRKRMTTEDEPSIRISIAMLPITSLESYPRLELHTKVLQNPDDETT